MEDPGIQLQVAQIPATQVVPVTPVVADTKIYPLVEELTFRAIVNSENEAYSVLRAVQILINEFGVPTLLNIVNKLETKPALVQKAKGMLPYLSML